MWDTDRADRGPPDWLPLVSSLAVERVQYGRIDGPQWRRTDARHDVLAEPPVVPVPRRLPHGRRAPTSTMFEVGRQFRREGFGRASRGESTRASASHASAALRVGNPRFFLWRRFPVAGSTPMSSVTVHDAPILRTLPLTACPSFLRCRTPPLRRDLGSGSWTVQTLGTFTLVLTFRRGFLVANAVQSPSMSSLATYPLWPVCGFGVHASFGTWCDHGVSSLISAGVCGAFDGELLQPSERRSCSASASSSLASRHDARAESR